MAILDPTPDELLVASSHELAWDLDRSRELLGQCFLKG